SSVAGGGARAPGAAPTRRSSDLGPYPCGPCGPYACGGPYGCCGPCEYGLCGCPYGWLIGTPRFGGRGTPRVRSALILGVACCGRVPISPNLGTMPTPDVTFVT